VVYVDTRSSQHTELAAFLMSRRTRLRPESCGLPQFTRRRRTPGLRRDEVSALAGISTAYYTWIEQGRTFDVSVEVLEAIAGALQLNEIEAAHLFTLAGKATPHPVLAIDSVAVWRDAICQFVRLFEYGPALALSPCLAVTAANHAARKALEVDVGTNFAEAFFFGARAAIYRSADTLAGALVALLRRNHARDIENEHFNDIVGRLRERSAVFKALWDGHIVDSAPLFEVEIEQFGSGRAPFDGVIVSDPIAAREFALFMNKSNKSNEEFVQCL
jgi:transcriptional regulator with XRE-family HTH domain